MFEREVGQAIAKLRGSRTCRAVAKKGKIHSSAWSAHERGKRQLRRVTLGKILKGLDCTQEQLEEEAFRQLEVRFGAKRQGPPALAPESSPQYGEGIDPATRPLLTHAYGAAHHFTLFAVRLMERLVKALRPDSSRSD